MNRSGSLDWEKLYPLTNDQIDDYLILQEEANDIGNLFQLQTIDKETDIDHKKSQTEKAAEANEADNVFMSAFRLFRVSKHEILESASSFCDPRVERIRQKINQRIDSGERLITTLSKGLEVVEDIGTQLKDLTDSTEHLLSSTQRLSKEKQQIESIVQEIETHLSQFTFLDEVAVLLRQSLVQHPDLFLVLEKLKGCLAFMQKNRHFTDAALYETRYRQCLLRILTEFRQHLLTSFTQWSSTIATELPHFDNMVDILVFFQTGSIEMQFKQLCVQLKSYAQEIENCCPDDEFDVLRIECINAYIQTRTQWTMQLVQLVLGVNHVSDRITRATELCGFIDTLVLEESTNFQLIFNAKYLKNLDPFFSVLSKSILEVLFRTDFSNSIEELSTILRFLLVRHTSNPFILDPLKEYTEKCLKNLIEMSISICSNENEWMPSIYFEKMLKCRNLTKDILQIDMQLELISIICETCGEMLIEKEKSNITLFHSLNDFRETLFQELQEWESLDAVTSSNIDQFKLTLLGLDTVLIEVQEHIIDFYTNKCMSLLSRFMNLEGISNMKDSKTKTSIEHILEAYETWNLEFQKLIPQLHKTLNPRTSVCKAFNQSIEKAYARFYKWIHTIHPNTEFSNIMSVHECAKFLATQN